MHGKVSCKHYEEVQDTMQAILFRRVKACQHTCCILRCTNTAPRMELRLQHPSAFSHAWSLLPLHYSNPGTHTVTPLAPAHRVECVQLQP